MATAQELEAARHRQARWRREQSQSKEIAGDGRKVMQIDTAYFNQAVEHNGIECWDDPEFVRDMQRIDPNIVVDYAPKIMVGGRGRSGQPRNRFGRVSERWAYRDNRKVRVV